jgi:peroxiredoxin
LAGKDVILYFYPKDDTPGCTKEACGFRDGWSELKKRGAVVLGVSADSSDRTGSSRQKYKLPFTLLSDPDRARDGEVRRVGRKDDVREEGQRRHPIHRCGSAPTAR